MIYIYALDAESCGNLHTDTTGRKRVGKSIQSKIKDFISYEDYDGKDRRDAQHNDAADY